MSTVFPKPAPIKAAIRDWQLAKSCAEIGGGVPDFASQLTADNALDRVSAAARSSVGPSAAIALMIAGYRLALDTLATEGPDDLQLTLERLKRDLEASACQCGGSGEIIKAGYHPGDPAAAEPCLECHGGDKP